MPDLLDVAPTQGNLLELRERLERIREGHDLLERKREALVRELQKALQEAEALDERAASRLQAAHEALEEARMELGTEGVRWIALAPTARFEVRVEPRTVMGVRVPAVRTDLRRLDPPYGPGATGPALDEARERWLEVGGLVGELAEKKDTVWRLALEFQRTQRRVNAMEEVVMPRYEATVDHVERVLEDEEREAVIRAKKVKSMGGDRGRR